MWENTTHTPERFPSVSAWALGKRRKRAKRNICPADFCCFFSEFVFHPSPRPLLCSSEEHQVLVHGNVRERAREREILALRNRTTDDCFTDFHIKLQSRHMASSFHCKLASWFWRYCKVKTAVFRPCSCEENVGGDQMCFVGTVHSYWSMLILGSYWLVLPRKTIVSFFSVNAPKNDICLRSKHATKPSERIMTISQEWRKKLDDVIMEP